MTNSDKDLAALPALLEAVDGQDWPDPDAESKLRALAPSLARALLAAEAEKGRLREELALADRLAEAVRASGIIGQLPAHHGLTRIAAALAAYDAARTGREEGTG